MDLFTSFHDKVVPQLTRLSVQGNRILFRHAFSNLEVFSISIGSVYPDCVYYGKKLVSLSKAFFDSNANKNLTI